MGFVYVHRQGAMDLFTIGATTDYSERLKIYARANPLLTKYRKLSHSDHFALETFLLKELGSYRVNHFESLSWFSVTSNELDAAIERAKDEVNACIAHKKRSAEVKNQQSTGSLLQPTDRLRIVYNELIRVSGELRNLKRDAERLKYEAMAAIGNSNGIQGLFEWPSREEEEFEETKFSKAYPELYRQFLKKTFVRKWKVVRDQTGESDPILEDLDPQTD